MTIVIEFVDLLQHAEFHAYVSLPKGKWFCDPHTRTKTHTHTHPFCGLEFMVWSWHRIQVFFGHKWKKCAPQLRRKWRNVHLKKRRQTRNVLHCAPQDLTQVHTAKLLRQGDNNMVWHLAFTVETLYQICLCLQNWLSFRILGDLLIHN